MEDNFEVGEHCLAWNFAGFVTFYGKFDMVDPNMTSEHKTELRFVVSQLNLMGFSVDGDFQIRIDSIQISFWLKSQSSEGQFVFSLLF